MLKNNKIMEKREKYKGIVRESPFWGYLLWKSECEHEKCGLNGGKLK